MAVLIWIILAIVVIIIAFILAYIFLKPIEKNEVIRGKVMQRAKFMAKVP